MTVMTLFKETTNNANVMSKVMGEFIVWKLVCWVFVYSVMYSHKTLLTL